MSIRFYSFLSRVRRERGAYFLLFAGISLVFLALLGLAVDTVKLQRDKLTLQRAVDSSAVAATNLLEKQLISDIQVAADRLVRDNLKRSGIPDANVLSVVVTPITPPPSPLPRQIQVSATIRSDLYLLNLLPFIKQDTTITADATAKNVKRTVALVLDVSGSMGGAKFTAMKAAAIQFVNLFGGDDRLAVISFHANANVDFSMALGPFPTVPGIINGLTLGGVTNTGEAISLAIQELNSSVNNDLTPQDMAAVVIITDGAPHGQNGDPTPPGISAPCLTALGGNTIPGRERARYIYAAQQSDLSRGDAVGNVATGLFPRIFTLGIGTTGTPNPAALCTGALGTNTNYPPTDPYQCYNDPNAIIKNHLLARVANDQLLLGGIPPYPDFPTACVPTGASIATQPQGQFFPITALSQLDTVLQAIGQSIRTKLDE